MTATAQQVAVTVRSAAELLISYPLYKVIPLDSEQAKKLFGDVRNQRPAVDCYCLDCDSPSVFTAIRQTVTGDQHEDHVFVRTLVCSRNELHLIYAVFHHDCK